MSSQAQFPLSHRVKVTMTHTSIWVKLSIKYFLEQSLTPNASKQQTGSHDQHLPGHVTEAFHPWILSSHGLSAGLLPDRGSPRPSCSQCLHCCSLLPLHPLSLSFLSLPRKLRERQIAWTPTTQVPQCPSLIGPFPLQRLPPPSSFPETMNTGIKSLMTIIIYWAMSLMQEEKHSVCFSFPRTHNTADTRCVHFFPHQAAL